MITFKNDEYDTIKITIDADKSSEIFLRRGKIKGNKYILLIYIRY
mgnify:CR=1 FL=1